MGLGNLMLLSQVTAYVLSFLLSFFILVPLAVYTVEFSGHCLLFATGFWNKTSPTEDYILHVEWGDEGLCSFPIFLSVAILPLSLFYILWMSIFLFKNTDLSWLATFLALLTSVIVTTLMFGVCIILTAGFSEWCKLIEAGIDSCGNGEFINFMIEDDVNKSSYYAQFGIAQFGAWFSLVAWLIQTVLASYKMYNFHKHEHILVSMTREKQRLLQRVTPDNLEVI